MENLYEGMPTYYIKLVKQHTEEIKAQMLENFNRQRALQDKIDRHTKCQCSACKV